MSTELVKVFLIGFGISYIASLPFGIINLSVVDITIKRGFKQGAFLSLSAAAVEFFQAYIAAKFASWFAANPNVKLAFEIGVIPIFILLAGYYISKNYLFRSSESVRPQRKIHGFFKGIIVSLLNPVAIPFWVFYATYLSSAGLLTLDNTTIITFVCGTTSGTFFCLITFALFSYMVASRIGKIKQWTNEILGVIFLGLAIYQLIRVF